MSSFELCFKLGIMHCLKLFNETGDGKFKDDVYYSNRKLSLYICNEKWHFLTHLYDCFFPAIWKG